MKRSAQSEALAYSVQGVTPIAVFGCARRIQGAHGLAALVRPHGPASFVTVGESRLALFA